MVYSIVFIISQIFLFTKRLLVLCLFISAKTDSNVQNWWTMANVMYTVMRTILMKSYPIAMNHYAVLHVIVQKLLSEWEKIISNIAALCVSNRILFVVLFFLLFFFFTIFLFSCSGMKFRCASIECPEVFNGPKPECIYQSQFDRCCGKYECSECLMLLPFSVSFSIEFWFFVSLCNVKTKIK